MRAKGRQDVGKKKGEGNKRDNKRKDGKLSKKNRY